MTPLLSLHQISKRFGFQSPLVVDGVSFDVERGEIFALLGPSGCGKTTTLRLIAGFEWADTGYIRLEDREIESPQIHTPPERRQIGFVFQDYALFPHLNVLENVVFGLRKLPSQLRRERGREVLNLVGLAHAESRRPHHLSGGEQQRVALARSIAPNPKLILLDEPFSNLDASLRQATREEIRSLLKKTGMSTVLVTHDQEEALSFADRLAVMQTGRIEQVDTPEGIYQNPKTPFVANFIGKTNLIAGEAKGEYAETPLGRCQLNNHATGTVQLSIRPEHLAMSAQEESKPNQQAGEIVAREFKGHDFTYCVQVGALRCFVQADYRCVFEIGERVWVRVVEPAVVVERVKRET